MCACVYTHTHTHTAQMGYVSILQRAAACCSVLQCVAACESAASWEVLREPFNQMDDMGWLRFIGSLYL